ncbi:MAG TPA: zinc metalloprotease HtpX [Gemmatimonadales bacterium]|nr:zinc metalloprotease HtpX [Gemmatimonadales bacterium]
MNAMVKTFVLMAGLMALFLGVGQLVGGTSGMLVALALGGAMNFVMYFFSDKIVLRMYGAQVVTAEQAPELYALVDRLRIRAGLPMPVVAISPEAQPNAFATGRNPEHAVVAVTRGILEFLPTPELEGVIAHELAHIKNRDMLTSTIAAGMAGAISQIPYLMMFGMGRDREEGGNPVAMLAVLLLGPLAAMLIQMGISRQREYEADRVGAEILGRPLDLARALTRIDAYARRIPMEVNPAVAPLAQVNPLAAHGGGMAGLFATHPPTAERVARLEAMARGR